VTMFSTVNSSEHTAMRREYDLLVIGDSNLDVQLGDAPARLTFGQQEQLMNSGALTLGGSAAITACVLHGWACVPRWSAWWGTMARVA
jgi:hypothetical protein